MTLDASDSCLFLESSDGWAIRLTPKRLPLTIGRDPDNDIELHDMHVSRKHCAIEYRDSKYYVEDLGSRLGTLVGNQMLHAGEAVLLDRDTFLVFSSIIMRIRMVEPASYNRHELIEENIENADTSHGICLVDICDSTDLEHKILESTMVDLRRDLIGVAPSEILLIKNLGDGFLAIYSRPLDAILAARQLLTDQPDQSGHKRPEIRIALDAGPTFPSSTRDRIGLTINRAARFEKTQSSDISHPDIGIDKLKAKNRCLISKDMFLQMSDKEQEKCISIGKRTLKGFGDLLFQIFQLET